MATDVEINTIINTDRSNDGLTKLRKGLKDLISIQDQVGSGSANFSKLQKAINETEGKIGDLTDSFQTLRGSGVERTNASINLFKEGLLNADFSKVKLALQGIGSAMKAIPIFLLIEGAKLLYENFDKVREFFSQTKSESELLTQSLKRQQEELDNLNASINRVLTIRKAQGFSEIELLKIEIASGEQRSKLLSDEIRQNEEKLLLSKNLTDEEKKNLQERIDAQNKAYQDNLTNTVAATFRLDKAIEAESKKRLEEIAARIKKEEELFAQRFARRRELEKREADAEKQQAQELLDFTENVANKKRVEAERKLQEEINTVRNDMFLQSIERGKREFAIEQANLEKSLNGRIELIKRKRDEELAVLTAGSEAAIIVQQKADQQIFQEKLKSAQQEIEIAKSLNTILANLNQLQTQSENYELQQQKYQKDAAIQEDINRTQDALDRDELNKNKLLRNQNLTEKERERIIYNSETNQRNISERSKKDQLKLNADFAAKELAIRKDQFERNKKLQLSMAIINTAAAIVSALATVQPTYPAGVIAAAGAGVAGGAQIAAIASTKFDDGGARAMSGVTPSANIDTRGGLGSSGPSIPNNQPAGLGPQGSLTNNQSNNLIKVVVLDSDIREVSSKVDVLESRATFGA